MKIRFYHWWVYRLFYYFWNPILMQKPQLARYIANNINGHIDQEELKNKEKTISLTSVD